MRRSESVLRGSPASPVGWGESGWLTGESTSCFQCFRICEHHILFLSCTVLFETLAKAAQGSNWKLAEMKFCDFNEKHSLSRRLLPPGKIKNCNWEVFFLLKNISAQLQNGENRLSTYTNNCCSSYTRALVQASVSGKLAQLVETNSTVLISSATSLNLHSSIQMPENAPNTAPRGAPTVITLLEAPTGFKKSSY